MRNSLKKILVVLMFAFLVIGQASGVFAGRVYTLEDVVMEMESKLPNLKDAKGTQIVKIYFEGKLHTLRNNFLAKIPDRFKMTTSVPTPGTIEFTKVLTVFDGKTIWHYTSSPEEKRVIKWDLSTKKGSKFATQYMDRFKDSFSLIVPEKIIKMISADYDIKYVGKKTRGGKRVYVLRGTAKETPESLGEGIPAPAIVEYNIGVKDGFVYLTKAMDSNGKVIVSIAYENLKFNTGISNEEFKFQPPKGVEIFNAEELMEYLAP